MHTNNNNNNNNTDNNNNDNSSSNNNNNVQCSLPRRRRPPRGEGQGGTSYAKLAASAPSPANHPFGAPIGCGMLYDGVRYGFV